MLMSKAANIQRVRELMRDRRGQRQAEAERIAEEDAENADNKHQQVEKC